LPKLPERIYATWSEVLPEYGMLDAVTADPQKWFSNSKGETFVGVYQLVDVNVIKPREAKKHEKNHS
jgi:hypothetical protein